MRSRIALVLLIAFAWPHVVAAEDTRPIEHRWRLVLSPHAEHYGRSEDHRHAWLIGAEREDAEGSLVGAGYFRNSFGQASGYVYPWGGVHRNLLGIEPAFFKWAGGIIYSYRGEYRGRVPNIGGFTPVIIPALGWDYGRGVSVQVNFLGTAAAMLQFSIDLQRTGHR